MQYLGAVQDMAIRGAPAIAIAAALALAAELLNGGSGKQFPSPAEAQETVRKQMAYLVTRYTLVEFVRSCKCV